ncbi:sensor domain-containing diguanylate cyclase [Aestuariibacter salexigens]|uniref:sensor domain-containing diguanylate cyclase n=1 Tax=Aestuariibacter salexigens TaxID=226010 RepID=UPI00041125A3|nr:diguanylate cyclase [Aestuariibacter salexigens]
MPIRSSEHPVLLILGTAILYVLCARLSQIFAIPPGNITPVWIPSGLMLALAFRYGTGIWPGIFLGAFFGNVWAYFSTDSLGSIAASLASGTFNGVGDVIAIVVMARLIQRLTGSHTPFSSLHEFTLFVLICAILGAFISALFGVSGLYLFGFLGGVDYAFAFTNWWIGDGVGVLLFAPFFSAFLHRQSVTSKYFVPILLFSAAVFAFFTAVIFELLYPNKWFIYLSILLLPLAFISMLQAGQRVVFTVQIVVAAVAVVATNKELGPFSNYEIISPLMSLQLFVAMMSCIIFAIAVLVNQRNRLSMALQEKTEKLEALYRHDPLTGLWNRYHIVEFLDNELNRFKRSGSPFALYLIDVDDFKPVNDRYGHLEGDRILIELSKVFQSHVRAIDLIGRWGGEEFLVIAAESDEDGAEAFAKKLIEIVSEHDFGLPEPLTVSIGYTLCKDVDSQTSIVKRADDALYQAKAKGKNQHCSKV